MSADPRRGKEATVSDFTAFANMERSGWSDAARASGYVKLFASASDQAIDSLLDAVGAKSSLEALDLCCGQGNVSEALIGRGCQVVGVDFSPVMLSLARERVPNATFIEADAQDLPFCKREIAAKLLSDAGFANVDLTIVDCAWDLDTPGSLSEIFEQGTVRAAMLLASQPEQNLAAIRSALAQVVRQRFVNGGRWRVPVPAALLRATVR
jgi:trans-aconitate methyltransferase